MAPYCKISAWKILLLFTICSQTNYVQSTQNRVPLIPNSSQQMFELMNTVSISNNQHSANTETTSYIFKSVLKISSVWNSAKDQLLQIHFIESSITAPTNDPNRRTIQQEITKIPDRPFYISLVDGKPTEVIAHTSRDQSLLNLERGIASLLLLQFTNLPVKELDVSGQCTAYYSIKSSTKIEKIKTDCSHWDLRVNYRAEKVFGILQNSQQKIHFDLTADGTLYKVESKERHHIALESKPDVGSEVLSEFVLKHSKVSEEYIDQLNYATLKEAINSLLEWYRVFDIEADVDGSLSEIRGASLTTGIANHKKQLSDEYIGKKTQSLTIAQLLPLARITKQNEFVSILNSNQDLQAQLVDLLGAVQTIEAHNAINEVFKYEDQSHINLIEKYLQSLAIGTHPERAIIEDLFARITNKETPIGNENLRDTLLQTITALIKHLGLDRNDILLIEVRSFLLQSLESNCEKDISCKILFIRALQNLEDGSTVSSLIEQAVNGVAKVSVAAIQALKSFPLVNFNEGHRNIFTQIFYQQKRKYDTTARINAIDILLSMKPTKEQLGNLLDYLASQDHHFEIKTYVIQKLKMLSEKCTRFEALLKSCLAERPQINNYNIIAQKGLTTVLLRQLSQSPAFNESLLSVQEIYQGVLKRGTVDLIQSAGTNELSTFKLSLYTNGLTTFAGDNDINDIDDDAEEEDSIATAGMEIAVQGVLLRPYVFFNGQTELMGHVWSGTASDPTPAYQATVLTQDHEHYIILSSGATAYIRIIGAQSIDLNGMVQLSIWNRNANTEIYQNSGNAIDGLTTVGFTYGKLENHFTVTSEPNISLKANVDFYSGIKLCMQLQRSESILTYSNERTIMLTGNSHSYKKRVTTNQQHKSTGSTLALNQKNNEMCNIIFSD